MLKAGDGATVDEGRHGRRALHRRGLGRQATVFDSSWDARRSAHRSSQRPEPTAGGCPGLRRRARRPEGRLAGPRRHPARQGLRRRRARRHPARTRPSSSSSTSSARSELGSQTGAARPCGEIARACQSRPRRGAALQPGARAARDRDRADQDRDPLDRAGLPAAVLRGRRQRQPRAPVRARQGRHPRARRPAGDHRVARSAGQQPDPALPHPEGRVRPARGHRASRREETALLDLAAMVWREGSLSGESRRALLKLRSLGDRGRRAGDRLRAARARARCGVRAAAAGALERRSSSRFPYLKPGEDDAARARRSCRSPSCSTRAAGTCPPHDIDAERDAHLPAAPHRRPGHHRPDRGSGLRRWTPPARPSSPPQNCGSCVDRTRPSSTCSRDRMPPRLANRSRRPSERRRRPRAALTSTSTSSPTSSPASAPRSSCSRPTGLRRAVSARLARVLARHADADGTESDHG